MRVRKFATFPHVTDTYGYWKCIQANKCVVKVLFHDFTIDRAVVFLYLYMFAEKRGTNQSPMAKFFLSTVQSTKNVALKRKSFSYQHHEEILCKLNSSEASCVGKSYTKHVVRCCNRNKRAALSRWPASDVRLIAFEETPLTRLWLRENTAENELHTEVVNKNASDRETRFTCSSGHGQVVSSE